MVEAQGTPFVLHGLLASWLDKDPLAAGADGYDPGPLPTVVEPQPAHSTTLVVGSQAAVAIVENIGGTGLTGLSVRRGETEVSLALPPASVEQVAEALLGTLPAALVPTGDGERP